MQDGQITGKNIDDIKEIGMNVQKNLVDAQGKAVWIRPVLNRIEAGSAESGTLNVLDGGGGVQAS